MGWEAKIVNALLKERGGNISSKKFSREKENESNTRFQHSERKEGRGR